MKILRKMGILCRSELQKVPPKRPLKETSGVKRNTGKISTKLIHVDIWQIPFNRSLEGATTAPPATKTTTMNSTDQ